MTPERRERQSRKRQNVQHSSGRTSSTLTAERPAPTSEACHHGPVSSIDTPLGHVLPRRAERLVTDALTDTRVVVLNGARQCGKSTLARVIGDRHGAESRTLDAEATRRAALEDPTGFVQVPAMLVLDEIQRAPDLLLSIKAEVDRDQRPGRFLLTGSARVLGLRALPDALPGRTETIELWPFSQGEIDGAPDGFVDAAFTLGPDLRVTSRLTRADYAARVVRGGFPQAVARTDHRRRQRFLGSYVNDLVTRDVAQLSEIERAPELRTLMRLVAARSGQLLVEGALANDTRLSRQTIGRYLHLLEEVFLLKRIPAWSRNLSSRAVGTPKVALVDSGVAATLLAADAGWLAQPESPFGGLLEGFVLMELARQASWSDTDVELWHYRTRDQVEVDAVLENRRGQVVAVEVKSGATVRGDDFRGLRHLQARLGDDFLLGVVLYTGPETLPFGPNLRAMPVSALWQATAPEP